MLYFLIVSIYVLVCFLLLVVVLLQQGKGGDIAAAFGGSSSQTAFGARTGATVLTRATTVLGTLFMVGAFVLGIVGARGGGGSSVVSGVDGPPAEQQKAPELPLTLPPGQGPATTPPAPATTPAPTTPDAGKAKGGETPKDATKKPEPGKGKGGF
jgi:preprotein translocase subunit SecG